MRSNQFFIEKELFEEERKLEKLRVKEIAKAIAFIEMKSNDGYFLSSENEKLLTIFHDILNGLEIVRNNYK